MLPLALMASPAGEHDEMAPALTVARSIVRRTWPAVLISATPPGSVPLIVGIETKNVPVVGFHAGCSMPPCPICPGMVMGLVVRVTGGAPFVVEKRFPYAGVSALLAART
jgi:hypothetical protein